MRGEELDELREKWRLLLADGLGQNGARGTEHRGRTRKKSGGCLSQRSVAVKRHHDCGNF